MEIFQTIWTALATENEALMPYISIPFVFIEITETIFLSILLLNLNISKKKILLYIITASIISITTNLLFSDTFKVIINLIFTPIFAVFVLKLSFFKGLLIEFLPIIIILVSETIWCNLANIVFGISTNEVNTIPLYRITMACLNYIAIFIVCILSKKYNFILHYLMICLKNQKLF